MRQADIAAKARVAQSTVSRLEKGAMDALTMGTVKRICQALEIRVEYVFRTRGPDPDRLLDARHAEIVAAVIRRLGPAWITTSEYSFNDYGDRGSVDVLAWHSGTGALLLVEVKSELVDVQATLRSMDVKVRVVPRLVRRDRGWTVNALGSVLVIPDESSARRSVHRCGSIFDTVLPARTVEVRRWIAQPSGSLRGVWFLADMPARHVVRNPGSRGRVVRPRIGSVHAQVGSRTDLHTTR